MWNKILLVSCCLAMTASEHAWADDPQISASSRLYTVFVGQGATVWSRQISCELICQGDIANDFGTLGSDNFVSFGDFLAMLGLVGPCPGGTPGCIGDIADDFGTLNGGDGSVSFGDFLALLGLIGNCLPQ